MKILNTCVLSAAIVLASAAMAPAKAVDVLRVYTINAAGNCNGALPSFEGALRKRPTAVSNEGTSVAFVTCSLPGDFKASGNMVFLAAFTNNTPAAVTFGCTLVDGLASGFGGSSYYTRTVAIDASGAVTVNWTAEEERLTSFSPNSNLSCAVPAGVELNFVEVRYTEDNGVAASR